jgi:LuxR family transcriptional regulator, regulator of acetate metabolism
VEGSLRSPQDYLQETRTDLRRRLSDPGPTAAADLRALVEFDRERLTADASARQAQLEALVRVQRAMEPLRSCTTPQALIEAAPAALCESCGFSRAMLSEVRGSVWDPSILEVRDGIDPEAAAFRAYVESVEIPLDHLLLETDLVRRRIPGLVADAGGDPRTYKPLVAAARWTSYVAAPIMPTRRVIGFLHADRFGQDRPCDEIDRDALWSFAEHFGLLFERCVLVEALEDQRRRVLQTLRSAAAEIDEACDAEIALVRREPLPVVNRNGRGRTRPSRLDGLLTHREREVLELLASGATNAAVAEQLVVSEGTIKSHLKRIHRKLHVSNRAEAVATYLRLLRLDEQGPG